MVSLKADNDIVDLFSANTLACLDIETRTVHTKGELCCV